MPPGRLCSFRRSFRPDLDAPTAARRTLDDLRFQVDADVLERSGLALTEVVANSVTHARLRAPEVIDLQVWVHPALLRIEVTDNGPGFNPAVVRTKPDNVDRRGWGLWIVDRLTDRWGVDFSHSTRVWMEFDQRSR
jgi:anti-sigma regulatory factor (Ser/Thr protein kinase)